MTYRNRNKRSVEVEFISNAEYRIGEVRTRAVIYRRNGKYYVRGSVEFHAKFEPSTLSVDGKQ